MHSVENLDSTPPKVNPPASVVVRQATSDDHLVDLWLHGRGANTQRAYRSDVKRFLATVSKPLHQLTLGDLQQFADGLESSELRPASRHRTLSSVKSVFAFGHRIGYLPFDTARPLQLPGIRNQLSNRILEEGEVQRMLALEPNPRNQALLTLLYAAGVRASELTALSWRDVQERQDDAQITVYGKGDKTRVILLPNSVWRKLATLRNGAADHDPVFRSRKRGGLSTVQVWRIVLRAAQRAGITKAVSTHWLRHAHASHALDRGAPIHLVQGTLGHASVATTGRYLHARPTDSSSKYLPL